MKNNRGFLEVNLAFAKENFEKIKELCPNSMICPVIKDNAYGHGATVMAKLYESLGANYFAVSNIVEAVELREAGINLPILILGYTAFDDAQLLFEYNITQTVYSLNYAKDLNKCGYRIKCHLKVDSGMNRIGFKDVGDAYEALSLANLDFEGIFTHFAMSLNKDFTKQQFAYFSSFISELESKGYKFRIKHCCNSEAICLYPEYHLDMVRPGIILYGYKNFNFRQIMCLKSYIIKIGKANVGETIGYNCSYKCSKQTKVATVPLGYGDGVLRANKINKVLINGQYGQIVGNICMDQLMVDVSDIQCCEYDEVILFDDFETWAKNTNTISYELICVLDKRLPHKYI